MYEYSDSLKCSLCGQRFIVTSTELEHHLCHCSGIAKSPFNYIQPESKAPIREYDQSRGTGYVIAAMEESTAVPYGCVFVVDSKLTMGDFLETSAMKEFMAICNEKAPGMSEMDIVTVAFDGKQEDQDSIYTGSMSENFQHVAMIRLQIITGLRSYRITLKKVLAFERSSTDNFKPIVMAKGLIPTRDFYNLGYEIDRYFTDAVTVRNGSWIAYANELVRHAEPALYMSMGPFDLEEDGDYSLIGNYIPEHLTRAFYAMMAKNKDCRNKSVESVLAKYTNEELKHSVENFRSATGMRKQDKIEYLATGQHVEQALMEKINGYQYFCLKDLMEKGGYEYCGEECDSSYLELFDLRLLYVGTDENDEKIVYIPREYIFIFKRVLYSQDLAEKMEKMNLIDTRLNGFIYNYGVLSTRTLYKMYVDVFGPMFNELNPHEDELLYMNYVTQKYATWANRDAVGDIYFSDEGIYIFHERMEYPGEIGYYKQPNPMKPPVRTEIEAAGDREYLEYNETFDRMAIDLLSKVDNKDETTLQMMNYYMYCTMLFGTKQGFTPEEIFENLVRLMPIPADSMMYIYDGLCKENESVARWDIGGYSSNGLKELRKAKGKVQKLIMR